MSKDAASRRAAQVMRAAVEVLGEKGAGGLTHRAVDRHAGLPEGSTSNQFRTRAALLTAICRFLTEHDLAALEAMAARLDSGEQLTLDTATDGLVQIVETWTGPEAVFTAARLELFLIAHRDPEVAGELPRVRERFLQRTADWLGRINPGAGRNAPAVMAFVEGLTANQLLHRQGRMSRDEVRAAVRSVLAILA